MARTAVVEVPPTIFCTACKRHDLADPSERVRQFLVGEPSVCEHCKGKTDPWSAVLNSIRHEHDGSTTAPWQVFAAAGARQTMFLLDVEPDHVAQIDLDDATYKIPRDARLLVVGYTSQSGHGVTPLEVHGFTPDRFAIRRQLAVYGARFPQRSETETAEVAVLVVWTPVGEPWEVDALGRLVEAFEWYYAGRIETSVIPACGAVESMLVAALGQDLPYGAAIAEADVSARRVGVPVLPEGITELLKELRDHRNDAVHGVRKHGPPPSPTRMAELLCATVFRLGHLAVLRGALRGAPS